MKIVAVTNIKGGVAQGAATYTLRCEAGEGASAKKLVAGKRELPELLVQTGYERLDAIAAHDERVFAREV